MNRASILLVGANPTDLHGLVDFLKKSGFKTLVVESGKEIIQQVDRIRPDLILLNAIMPDIDGFETCRQLKAHETTRNIPVIFMIAFSDTAGSAKGFGVGGADYVTKPFQGEEVLARVNAHLTIRKLQHEIQEMNRKFEEISLSDPLTGMRNRRYLSKYLHSDIAEVHRNYHEAFIGKAGNRATNSDIVFLLLDLDHFKSVSDIYGHQISDNVLIQVREILENVCRESDILVRWAEDMFLVVNRYSDHNHVQIIAERIREAFEKHAFDVGRDRTIHLTCSIGSASYPFLSAHPDYLNWEQVVAIANKGIYVAKKSGRNAYVNIASTEHTRPDRLFQRIQEDLDALIKSEELRVTTSIPDSKTLVFR
jgi:diguanylate cyclase (GGDEF)-like protein